MIGVVEFVLLYLIVLPTTIYALVEGRSRLLISAFVVNMLLITSFLWSPLSGFHDVNDAGRNWYTDPWNALFTFPPLMQPHMWWLAILGGTAAVLAKLDVLPKIVPRILLSALLVLGAIGVDWGDPFGSHGGKAAAAQAKPVDIAALSCVDLVKNIDKDQATLAQQIAAKVDARAVSTRISRTQQIVVGHKNGSGDVSQCAETVALPTPTFIVNYIDGTTVEVTATNTFEHGQLTYAWAMGDINNPNDNPSDVPGGMAKPGAAEFSHPYDLGDLSQLEVTILLREIDPYGRLATSKPQTVTLHKPAATPAPSETPSPAASVTPTSSASPPPSPAASPSPHQGRVPNQGSVAPQATPSTRPTVPVLPAEVASPAPVATGFPSGNPCLPKC